VFGLICLNISRAEWASSVGLHGVAKETPPNTNLKEDTPTQKGKKTACHHMN
jgi:hypothetical protein